MRATEPTPPQREARRKNLSALAPLQTATFRQPRLLVGLLLLTPFGVATLLLLRNYLAFFGERYFIVMVPWLLLLAAVGADRLGRWVRKGLGSRRWLSRAGYTLPALFLVAMSAWPLPGQWSIPAAKEAWRQSVAYLADQAQPNHAILIHPDWVRYPFQYYFAGPGQTYAAFSTVTDQTDLDDPLQGVVGDHPVVWLVQSHLDAPDPERRVEQWLAARYPLVTELYPPGVTIKGYAPGYQLERLPPAAIPLDIEFSNGLRLLGYQADQQATARESLFHPPSGWVHVTLYWSAARPIDEAIIKPVVRLVGPEGVWGVSLARPTDALGLYPPPRWPPSKDNNAPALIIRHDLDVNLNPATPPGVYQLVVNLDGEEHPLGPVEIR